MTLLKDAGYELNRRHSSHEIYTRPGETVKSITINKKWNDRHLANKVLKIAGIDARL